MDTSTLVNPMDAQFETADLDAFMGAISEANRTNRTQETPVRPNTYPVDVSKAPMSQEVARLLSLLERKLVGLESRRHVVKDSVSGLTLFGMPAFQNKASPDGSREGVARDFIFTNDVKEMMEFLKRLVTPRVMEAIEIGKGPAGELIAGAVIDTRYGLIRVMSELLRCQDVRADTNVTLKELKDLTEFEMEVTDESGKSVGKTQVEVSRLALNQLGPVLAPRVRAMTLRTGVAEFRKSNCALETRLLDVASDDAGRILIAGLIRLYVDVFGAIRETVKGVNSVEYAEVEGLNTVLKVLNFCRTDEASFKEATIDLQTNLSAVTDYQGLVAFVKGFVEKFGSKKAVDNGGGAAREVAPAPVVVAAEGVQGEQVDADTDSNGISNSCDPCDTDDDGSEGTDNAPGVSRKAPGEPGSGSW